MDAREQPIKRTSPVDTFCDGGGFRSPVSSPGLKGPPSIGGPSFPSPARVPQWRCLATQGKFACAFEGYEGK